LQAAQAWSIGRTHVYGDITGVGIHLIQADQVVIDRALYRRVEVLANVDPQNTGVLGRLNPRQQMINPKVVKPHAVDDCLRFRQSENAWLGIAWLRARRHRADLDKSKTQLCKTINGCTVFVQTCGQPDRVRKIEPHDLHWQPCRRLAQQTVEPKTAARTDQVQGQIVRGFRGEFEEQLAGQVIHGLIGLNGVLEECAIIAARTAKSQAKKNPA